MDFLSTVADPTIVEGLSTAEIAQALFEYLEHQQRTRNRKEYFSSEKLDIELRHRRVDGSCRQATMEAWSLLQREGVLVPGGDAGPGWFCLSRDAESLLQTAGTRVDSVEVKPLFTSSIPMIFVSHSSTDAMLAEEVISLLRSALGLRSHEIRCTSVDGYRLPGGAQTTSQLRHELNTVPLVIGLISTSSLKSFYVLFELGARWGTDRPFIPILGAGIGASDLPPPLSEINALSCNNPAQMHQLIADVAAIVGREPDKPASYSEHISRIVQLASQKPTDGEIPAPLPASSVSKVMSPPSVELSEDAESLLTAATADKTGHILFVRSMTGALLTTNEMEMFQGEDAREIARWQSALDELIRHELVVDPKGKGEVFRVTNKGYGEADRVSNARPE